MKKSTLIKLTLLISVIGISGCNQVRSNNDDPAFLDATEIEELFTSHTVEAFNLNSRITSFTYYAANGEARQERLWEQRQGNWHINDKNQICLELTKGKERCRNIAKQNGVYKKYRFEKGEMKPIVRYRRFLPGNTLNL